MGQERGQGKKWHCYEDPSLHWICSRQSTLEAQLARENQTSSTRREAATIPKRVKSSATQLDKPVTTTEAKAESLSSDDGIAGDYKAAKSVDPQGTRSAGITGTKNDKGVSHKQYAVQLLAVRNIEALDNYRQELSHIPTQKFALIQEDKRWYILIFGIYSSYSEAKDALKAADLNLEPTPWIRPWIPQKVQLISD